MKTSEKYILTFGVVVATSFLISSFVGPRLLAGYSHIDKSVKAFAVLLYAVGGLTCFIAVITAIGYYSHGWLPGTKIPVSPGQLEKWRKQAIRLAILGLSFLCFAAAIDVLTGPWSI